MSGSDRPRRASSARDPARPRAAADRPTRHPAPAAAAAAAAPRGRLVRRRSRARCTVPSACRRTGPVILAGNHVGVVDGPLLAIFAPAAGARADQAARCSTGRSARFLRASGQIPLDRFHTDPAAVRPACGCCATATSVGIFPEGSRGERRPRPLPPRRGLLRAGLRRARWCRWRSSAPASPAAHANALPAARRHRRRRLRRARARRAPRRGRAPGNTWRGCSVFLREHMLVRAGRRAAPRPVATLPGPLPPGQIEDRPRHRGRRARSTMSEHVPEPVDGDRRAPPTADRCPSSRSSAAPTSASRRWSTASSAAARRSSRTGPGVTRDRVSYDAHWNGRAFTVVDTGGWDPDARGLAERIARAGRDRGGPRGRRALRRRRRPSGSPTPTRPSCESCAASGKPVVLAANKVDDQRTEAEADGPVEPGAGRAVPGLRAARPRVRRHARRRAGGAARAAAGAGARGRRPAPDRHRRQAQRRQVLLLNKLAGEDRVVVDDVAGTTVDPVDELVELGGRTWRFVDTAGIRKRVKEASGQEYYASLRTSYRDRARRGGGAGHRRAASRCPSRTCASCSRCARPGGRW